MTGRELYEAKLQTGLYRNYDREALAILLQDCERQAALMAVTRYSMGMEVSA